ncbi:DMT family transporter [Thermodesulfobacteriota bacterium]
MSNKVDAKRNRFNSDSDKSSTKKRSFFGGFLLLVSLSFAWGICWPVMKIALSELPVWTFRVYTIMFSVIGFITLIKLSGLSISIPLKELKQVLVIALFNISGWQILSAYGISNMNASRASIIAYTMPIWTTIAGRFLLAEKLTPPKLMSLFLGTAGIMVLAGREIGNFVATPIGTVFMIFSAISWGIGTALIKYYNWSIPSSVLACWQLMLGGIPVILGALVIEPSSMFTPVSWQCVLALCYVVLIGNIFSYWAWFKILGRFSATISSVGILMVPVIGVFSSGIMLSERIGIQEMAALILVVSSLSIIYFKKSS